MILIMIMHVIYNVTTFEETDYIIIVNVAYHTQKAGNWKIMR